LDDDELPDGGRYRAEQLKRARSAEVGRCSLSFNGEPYLVQRDRQIS